MSLVLGLETSCDETAASVVEDGTLVRSSVVSSQVDLHAAFGGVVPEVASRAHLELIVPVLREAVESAGLDWAHPGLDAVAVTAGPGLVGSLLVGVSSAKALSIGWGVPLVGVNHLEGHLFASLLESPDLAFPVVVLVVSGGHTFLVSMEAPGRYRLLGQTIDDAAGEAFDKVSRYLGLGYPGGPAVERAAREGNPEAYDLPRAMRGEGLDLSFSGLKTAVVRLVEREPEANTADVAASFQAAVVDVLVEKTERAAGEVGAKAICLGGGVAANGPLREAFAAAGERLGVEALVPSRAMCTDNAAMVAAAGTFRLRAGQVDGLDRAADPNWFLQIEA